MAVQMQIYISENRVREIMYEVLKPIVRKTREDSSAIHKYDQRLEVVESRQKQVNHEIQKLLTLEEKLADINKAILKTNMDITNFKGHEDGMHKKHF